MRTAGLAAAAGLLAQQIIKRDDEKRAFHQKLESALFENELKMGRIRPSKKGEQPTASYGGIGFNTRTDEEVAQESRSKIESANKLLPPGMSGSFLPEIEGLKFHEKKRDDSFKTRMEAIKAKQEIGLQLTAEDTAFINHVSKGGDTENFTYTPPPPPDLSPATADAGAGRQWGQGVLDFGRTAGRGMLDLGRKSKDLIRSSPGGGTPSPVAPQVTATGHKVGDIIKGKDGKKYEVTSILPNGDAVVEPI